MRVGQARKRDWNEMAIVDALEAIGAVIFRVSGVGCPDLFVYTPREGWQALEVKQPRGRLTPAQVESHRLAPIHVVRTVEEALQLFGVHS